MIFSSIMQRKENDQCQNDLNFDLSLGTEVQDGRGCKSQRSQGPGEGQAAAPLNPHREEKKRVRSFVLTSLFVCVTVA